MSEEAGAFLCPPTAGEMDSSEDGNAHSLVRALIWKLCTISKSTNTWVVVVE
jgi:hypothetical protein